MNAQEKKLLKIFLKENIKHMLTENPDMLTEQGFWDGISRMLGGLGQQDQQLNQRIQNLETALAAERNARETRIRNVMDWVIANFDEDSGNAEASSNQVVPRRQQQQASSE